jgi:uncharacterized protein YutE (UPF0331/DUF86 family)
MKTGVITQKLNSRRQYVEELTSLSQRSLPEYLQDAVLRRAVERVLQITIECRTGWTPSPRPQEHFSDAG